MLSYHPGIDVYKLAPFEVNQAHADRAIANLRRFTLVLALERLDAEAWGLLSWTMNFTSTSMKQSRAGTNYGARWILRSVVTTHIFLGCSEYCYACHNTTTSRRARHQAVTDDENNQRSKTCAGSTSFVKKLRPEVYKKLRDAFKYDYQVYQQALDLHDEFLAGWRVIQPPDGPASRAPDESSGGPSAGNASGSHVAGRKCLRAHRRRFRGHV
jgi:hypothetical protein